MGLGVGGASVDFSFPGLAIASFVGATEPPPLGPSGFGLVAIGDFGLKMLATCSTAFLILVAPGAVAVCIGVLLAGGVVTTGAFVAPVSAPPAGLVGFGLALVVSAPLLHGPLVTTPAVVLVAAAGLALRERT